MNDWRMRAAIVVLLSYLTMFFLWVPVRLAAGPMHAPWLSRAIDGYDGVAHRWWVTRLASDNYIVELRRANMIWWCDQFTTCTMQ